jgi:hypothetical protein
MKAIMWYWVILVALLDVVGTVWDVIDDLTARKR